MSSQGTQLATYEHSGSTLSQYRTPESVLEEARRAAVALKSVIDLKHKPVVFNGETYLEFEDWQTVGKFYGCTVKIESTSPVQFGDVHGFEATALVLDSQQNEISRAESMCLSDEENWGAVPVYEWQDELDDNGKKIWVDGPGGKKRPKGKRVQTGTKAKPLFQLRSMAQTRAGARALRQVFSWVVVLAGYKPTVAEELTGNEFDSQQEPEPERKQVRQPQKASEAVINEISGIIATPKLGNNPDKRTVWLKVNEDLLSVAEEKIGTEVFEKLLHEGWHLSAKVKQTKHDTLGSFWIILEVLECSQVQEGEVVVEPERAADGTKTYFDTQAAPEGAEKPAATAGESLGELFAEGKLKPASSLPTQEAAKPGTIGMKRAQRLYAMVTQNHQKTGFTKADLDYMKEFYGLEHLRDLPVEHYESLESYADGSSKFVR